MSKERKLVFLPDDRAPLVTENNVEEVTYFVIKRVVNAFLWERMKEHGLVPFVNIRGPLPSGDIAINWFPAIEVAQLVDQFTNSEDPLAKSLRYVDTIERQFREGAEAMFRLAKTRNNERAVALQEAWERQRLEDGC